MRLYDVPNTIEDIIKADGMRGHYITWKATSLLQPEDSLMYDYDLTHSLECKAALRRLLDAELFPEFCIIAPHEADRLTYQALVNELGTDALVVQEDFSTGGKGTYFVYNAQQLTATLHQADLSQPLVISRKVQGESMGVQCFIGGGQVYYAPWWHKDLVAIDGVSKATPGATRYCGAEISNIPVEYQAKLTGLIDVVGKCLVRLGYKGVFGIDLVVADGDIYLIEVNPRFTAVSQLYASAMRAAGYGTDFMTEAVKQCLGLDDACVEFATKKELGMPLSYLKLQNIENHGIKLSPRLQLGLYRDGSLDGGKYEVADLGSSEDVIVIPEADLTDVHEPGRRIFSIIFKGEAVLDGELLPEVLSRLERLRSDFVR